MTDSYKDAPLKNKPMGFDQICRAAQTRGESYSAPISDNWRQGRTAYGGLTLGLSYMAAQALLTYDKTKLAPLKSVHINFVGPVTDDPHFTATMLRQGRNVTSAQVTGAVKNAGEADKIISSANFVFGASRASEISQDFPAPDASAPEGYEPFIPEIAQDFAPNFVKNFDTRLVAGARPMSGASEGYIRTWSRHKDEASREGMASLLCISDVLPPAAMPTFKSMGPVSSVNFALNILTDTPQTKDGWWQIETRQSAASGGYSSQIMRIWNTDGELVAEGMQSMAVFV